ncbi:Atu4866 domain-containing protein [Mycolicibacterium mengxianglii]|uniref:Atu4866 domain-containing protein n=1 Tax=Mycolicibacterium mengxianglii TaxID=2736649 RepID=UPI0027DAA730|nr:Atu4866 domain-containing protein [Mycolicibacterium mengxianglii]
MNDNRPKFLYFNGITNRRSCRRTLWTSVAVATGLFLTVACQSAALSPGRSPEPPPEREQAQVDHPYVGMWVTGDGHIRQELLPNGRYDEARGERMSAYTGRYEVRGNHIDYWDDTGFTADGTFVSEDVLHHGGMIFYRE